MVPITSTIHHIMPPFIVALAVPVVTAIVTAISGTISFTDQARPSLQLPPILMAPKTAQTVPP